MPMNSAPKPLPDGELQWWVNYAKTLPTYGDAQYIENALQVRLAGLASLEEMDAINEIRSYFNELFYEKIYSEVRADVENRLTKTFGLPKIDVSDEQVAEAIVKIQDNRDLFKAHRDYHSIYRILVDCCGWTDELTDFCLRLSRLDFHGTLQHSADYNPNEPSKSSLYQAIQKGKNEHQSWPNRYDKWLTYKTNDATFNHRRNVAKVFLEILETQ